MARIKTYPIPEGADTNERYKIRVRLVETNEWRDIQCCNVLVDMHDIRSASMAFFEFEGEIEIEVRVDIKCYWVYKADIRPVSRNIQAEMDANGVRFKLSQPENLSVELNNDRFRNLHIFAGPIRDFDAGTERAVRVKGGFSGEMLTKQLESLPEGRTVVFEEGFHEITDVVFRVPSNTNVLFQGGAFLGGALVCDSVENVCIRGYGVIWQKGIDRDSGKSGLAVRFSRNVTVRDIIFVNPPHYTITAGASRDITIKNIKVFSCYGWCDGISIMSCENILVDGCFLRTSDDCVSIYGQRWDFRGDTSGITVSNTTLWADVAHPINIGTHGDHANNGDTLEHLTFLNIDILEHHEMQPGYLGCMAINAGDKNTVRNVLFKDINVEPFKHGKLLDVQVKLNNDYNPAPGTAIENIVFKNIHYNGTGEEPSVINGYDESRLVRDVEIDGLFINGRHILSARDGNIIIGGYTKSITFK